MIKRALLSAVVLITIIGAISRARAADAYDAKAEWQLLQLINKSRAEHGLPQLQLNTRLQVAARMHTKLMAVQNTLSHQLPGESVLGKRLELSGAYFYTAGETAAFNYTPDSAQESFMHSPPHRRIILDPRYNAVGVGVVERDGIVWVTEDFAQFQAD